MAGSWAEVQKVGVAAYCGANQSMFSLKRSFIADATDASIPNWLIDDVRPSFLADIGIVFDSSSPPDNLVVTVKDVDGLQVYQGTFTESQRVMIEERPSLIGGGEIIITGNTTNNSKAKVVLNFANNLR